MSEKHKYTIEECIKILAGKPPKWIFEGIVKEVYPDKNECTVYMHSLDVDLPGVIMTPPNDGGALKVVPVVGSIVLVCVSDMRAYYIHKVSAISKMELGGDKYGTIKAEDLIKEIKLLKASLDKALAALGIINAPTGNFSNLINEDIRHGN